MKSMFGEAAVWLAMTALLGAAAFAFGQEVQLPEGEGNKVLETSCTTCYDLTVTTAKRLSKDEWKDMVNLMIALGTQLKDEEAAILVDYLARNFGPNNP